MIILARIITLVVGTLLFGGVGYFGFTHGSSAGFEIGVACTIAEALMVFNIRKLK